MEKNEKDVFLNVNPYCKDPQVIHIESIAGCNVVFLGAFTCKKTEKEGMVKVTKAEFETYPMFGIFRFGFNHISLEKNYQCGKKIINFELGLYKQRHGEDDELDKKEIIWKLDDIIDNKITFNILGLKFERNEFKIFLKFIAFPYYIFRYVIRSIFKIVFHPLIPTNGRPCQFKLVDYIK